MKPSTVLSFLALALPFASATPLSGHHHEVAKRARADVDIHKRAFTDARFTFYDVAVLAESGIDPAIGRVVLATTGAVIDKEFQIVALNTEQFGPGYPGQYCFKTITILCNGITVQATITDECMGCPWGGLDLSRGLFDIFAPESEGVIYGDWWFDDW